MKTTRTFQQRAIRSLKFLGIITGALTLLFIVVMVVAVIVDPVPPTHPQAEAPAQTNVQPTEKPTPVPTFVVPTATPRPVPTKAPVATLTPSQLETLYKDLTTDTTVPEIDKMGNQGKKSDQHFTTTLLGFVKNEAGDTVGANLSDASSLAIVQVVFPTGTNLARLNEGDVLEIWGQNLGVFSGQNALGATVQEVGMYVYYLTDQTTGYVTAP